MRPDWRPWSLVTRLALTVVITLLAMLFAGIWLDGVFGTRPLMTLVLSLVGMVAATINCYKMVTDSLGDITQVHHGRADNEVETRRRRKDTESRYETDESEDDEDD